MSGASSSDGDLVTVHVLGLPLDHQGRSQQHFDELARELTLIAEGLRQSGDRAQLPSRLLDCVDQLSGEYSTFTAEQQQQLDRARFSGEATTDLTYVLPATVVPATLQLGELLDEADEYCRQGRYLLTLSTPDDLVDYRHWFLGEFVRQAAGEPPTRWDERPERA